MRNVHELSFGMDIASKGPWFEIDSRCDNFRPKEESDSIADTTVVV